jgi:proline iminopeptidase
MIWKMKSAINGAELRVYSSGQGPPLLLLHGGPGMGDDAAPLAALLTGQFRVIRFDQRGGGASSRTPPYDVPTLLADMEAIRVQQGSEAWAVAGHSWGADVALAYALTYPKRVSALLHICGTGIQNDRDWKAAYEQGKSSVAQAEPGMQVDQQVKRSYLESWRRWIKRPELLREIAKSDVPALFVVGELDIRPSWPNAQLANLMPQGSFISLAQAGHQPWAATPEALQHILLDFLNAHGASSWITQR